MKKCKVWTFLDVVLFAVLFLTGCGDLQEKPLADQNNPNGAASDSPGKYWSSTFRTLSGIRGESPE